MGLVVQKFGGTSVADPDRIREVADHVARTLRRGDQVVVVVSAMGKETDELLHLALRSPSAEVANYLREARGRLHAGIRESCGQVKAMLKVYDDAFEGLTERSDPIAFRTAPGQGVNIGRNVWHGILTPLDAVSDFAVIDRGGEGVNLEEHFYAEPFLIR